MAGVDQDDRIRRVLWKLELMAHGPCQAYNPSGGHSGEPDDRFVAIVAREDTPEHLMYRKRYDDARSYESREAVINEAEETHRSMIRRTQPVPENLKTFEQFVVEDGEGYDADVVAARYGVAVPLIRRIRSRAGRDPDSGRSVEVAVQSREELAKRAKGLRERGSSTREIALVLGVHQTQVMRWIRSG